MAVRMGNKGPGEPEHSRIAGKWSGSEVKLDTEDQANLVEGHPSVVSPVPGYWGRKGSTFVAFEQADEALIASLLKLAWSGVAPKRQRQG